MLGCWVFSKGKHFSNKTNLWQASKNAENWKFDQWISYSRLQNLLSLLGMKKIIF